MTSRTDPAPFAFPTATWPEAPGFAEGQKYLVAVARLQTRAFKAAMRYQIETLSFLKRRCEEELKLADDLVAGDDLNDALDVVSIFMQNAVTDYAAEAGRMATIGSRLASEAAKRVREEAESVAEDVAAKTVAA